MKRGEIWLVNLDPTKGHEQGGERPALIVSIDEFNESGLELVVICPITSKYKGFPTHVSIAQANFGLKFSSYIKVEDIRSVSSQRLFKKIGQISPDIMEQVEIRIRRILGI